MKKSPLTQELEIVTNRFLNQPYIKNYGKKKEGLMLLGLVFALFIEGLLEAYQEDLDPSMGANQQRTWKAIDFAIHEHFESGNSSIFEFSEYLAQRIDLDSLEYGLGTVASILDDLESIAEDNFDYSGYDGEFNLEGLYREVGEFYESLVEKWASVEMNSHLRQPVELIQLGLGIGNISEARFSEILHLYDKPANIWETIPINCDYYPHVQSEAENGILSALYMVSRRYKRDYTPVKDIHQALPELRVGEKYDLIYGIPPLNMVFDGTKSDPPSIMLDEWVMANAVHSLKPGGKAIIGVSSSFLWLEGSRGIHRKFHLDLGTIEKVVQFPRGILSHNSMPFALVVLVNPGSSQKIQFIDAEPFLIEEFSIMKRINVPLLLKAIDNPENWSRTIVEVSYDTIRENGNALNLGQYQFRDLSGNPLSDFLTELPVASAPNVVSGRLVSYNVLKPSITDYLIDADELNIVEEIPSATKLKGPITESMLLVSHIFNQLKPTFLKNDSGVPVYVENEVKVYKLSTNDLLPGYLVYLLHEHRVKTQHSAFQIHSGFPHITSTDFLRIKIEPEIPISDQEYFLSQKYRTLATYTQSEFLDRIEEEKENYKKELQNLKHSLKNRFNGIISSIEVLSMSLAELDGLPFQLDKPVMTGKPTTFGDLLTTVSKSHEEVLRIIDYGDRKIQAPHLKSIFNLKDLIEDYKINNPELRRFEYVDLAPSDFGFDQDPEIIPALVSISESEIQNLFDNIIQNARDHAFPDNYLQKYGKGNVFTGVFVRPDLEEVELVIANDGKRWPEKMTQERFTTLGEKSKTSEGSGIGGNAIENIVKTNGGRFDLKPNPDNSGFSVSFHFFFPLQINSEI